jgi:hypothetical protein
MVELVDVGWIDTPFIPPRFRGPAPKWKLVGMVTLIFICSQSRPVRRT